MAETPSWLSEYPVAQDDSWLNQYKQVEEKTFLDVSDTASALGRAATSLGTTIPASLSQAWGGLANPWKRGESYLKRQESMKALQEEMRLADEEAAASGDLSSVSSTIRGAIPSLGFSGATLAPSVAAYGGTLALTKSPTAAAGASAAASGLLAYRMAGAQFLDDARDRINDYFQKNLGRLPNEQEQEEAYQEILPLAQKFGVAEAGPEAIGNLALGGAGKYIRRALGGKNGVMQLASNALGKVTGAKAVLAGTGATIGEIGTEAVTGVEQNRIQKQFEEGVMRGESPESVAMPDRTLGEYAESFKEVAPTTLALTGMMGAAGLGPSVVARGYRALKPTAPEKQTDVQRNIAAETGATMVDEVPPQTNEEKQAAMEAGGVTVVDPQGNTAVIAEPAQTMRNPALEADAIAAEVGRDAANNLAAIGSTESAAAQNEFLKTAGEILENETPQPPVQPSEEVEKAAEVAIPPNEPNLQEALPEIEGGEQVMPESRQLPVLPKQPAAQAQEEGAGGAGIQPPTIETQENAPSPEIIEESLRQEPQDRVEGREAEIPSLSGELRGPAEGEVEEEVMPSPEVAAELPAAPSLVDNLPALIAVRDNNATPEQVQSLVDQGLVEQVERQNIITEAGVAAMPKAERPKLTPVEREAEVAGMAVPVERDVTTEVPVFTRDEIAVSKPSVSRRSRPNGVDGESITEIKAPSKVTAPDNWSRLGDIDKLDATVEARLDFVTGKTPKKTDKAWTAFAGRRTQTGRSILARNVTYNEAIESAKDFVESANFQPASAPAGLGAGAATTLQGAIESPTAPQAGPSQTTKATVETQKATPPKLGRKQNEIRNQIKTFSEQPVTDDSVARFIRSAISKWGSPSSLRKVRFSADAPLQVGLEPDGSIIFGLGGKRIAERVREAGSPQAGFQRLADALEEELIHLADFLAIRKKWESQGKPKNFILFTQRETRKLTEDLQKTAKTLTASDRESLRKVIGSALAAYDEIEAVADLPLDELIERSANTSAPILAHSELVRSLIQANRSGEITATGYQKILGVIKQWYEDALKWLKQAYKPAKDGTFGPVLADRIASIEGVLKSIEEEISQTTAAVNETPAPLAEGAGAAVVQSEPVGGSIPTVEKESPKTAIESTGKYLESGYGAVIKESRDLLRALGTKSPKAQTAIEARLKSLKTAKELQDAFEVVTGEPTRLTNINQLRNNILNALLDEYKAQQPAALPPAEQTFDAAERQAEEDKRAESIARLFDKERKNPVKGIVSQGDVEQAIGIVGNNGTVPNAPFTWRGKASDLLTMRNTPFAKAFPGAIAAASVPDIEGVYENGMTFVFTDQIVVTDLDRRKAAEDGVSPSVAASMRVITHENYHKGLSLLSPRDQSRIMALLRTLFPAAELDALARRYKQYANWRTNPASEMALLDERLQKAVEDTKTLPADGPWKEFWELIKSIWRKITGQPKAEPKLEDLKDVVRLIRKSLKDAHKPRPDVTKDGGRVLMSFAGEPSRIPYGYFTQAVNLNNRVETGMTHYDAWIKHVLRQIPAYQKDGLSERERFELADKWLVAHPQILSDSIESEGFMTPDGFLDRKQAFKKFIAMGGKPNLVPGEVRDWLDSSDLSGPMMSIGAPISYASESEQAESQGQQTARALSASPRQLEAMIGVRKAYEALPKTNSPSVALTELFAKTKELVPNLTQAEFNDAVQGMYEDNAALFDDANEPTSIVILPNVPMMSLGASPEQKSATDKFRAAIIEAAKGMPDMNEYAGKLVSDKDLKAIEADPHKALWFEGFMQASADLIKDLQSEGMSLEEIYDKLSTPAFLQQLGLFDPESGQGQAAVVLVGNVMEKTLIASRKVKNKADKARLDALHRKVASYFYGLGTRAGQNLLLFQLLENDPRTRFVFLENNAASEMLKRAGRGLNVSFGGAYSDTQVNTAGNVETSATSATANLEQEAAELEEDDQDAIDLAEGEATLTDKQKSAWEKFKDAIRTKGLIAKALAAIRNKNQAKASISGEARNAIFQMTEEELLALDAKMDQVMLDAEKEFFAGGDSQTKQKRTKMVNTAKKRAEKGKDTEITSTEFGKLVNQARRDIKGPTGKAIQWREIFRQSGKSVEEVRKNMLSAIMGMDAFKDMDDAQKRKLADMFSEIWGKERAKVLGNMQKAEENRVRQIGLNLSENLEKSRNQIIEAANLGVFDNDELTRILGDKFGFKTKFTDEEKAKLSELAEKIQEEDNPARRNKFAYEFMSLLESGTKIPIPELLANWWTAAVLTGGNTLTAIGVSFLNGTGISIFGTHLSRAFRHMVAGDMPKAIDSITSLFKAYARHFGTMGSAGRRAWQYLWTGKRELLEAAANDPFKNVKTLADIERHHAVADAIAKDPNKLKAFMGKFMQFAARLLTALDAFNVIVTKAGTFSLALRQSNLTAEQIVEMEREADLKVYKENIVKTDPEFGGKYPTTSEKKAYLDSLAEAALYKDMQTLGAKMENADWMAAESAMTTDPTGFGGMVYQKIKTFDKEVTTKTRHMLAMAEDAYLDAKKNGVTGQPLLQAWGKMFAIRVLNLAAEQGLNVLGLRFARFAGNKFNQSLSFIPVLGALRILEQDNPKLAGSKEAFRDALFRNQTIGFALAIAGVMLIKSIMDEPDDEKRGWALNGGWNNLTPDQKKQKLSRGEKQYTLRIGDQVFNYQNWPIGQAIAAIGEMSDLIRYSPDKWKEKSGPNKALSAIIAGMTSTLEIPALTQVGEIFGNSMASKDPTEQTTNRLTRVIAGWAGGFMPRFIKDVDYMLKPEMNKYEGFWQKTAAHIPFYRSYVGKEYFDILGNQIKKNAIPGSRDFDKLASEPEYQMLGKLNSRGIWLTPANAEYRMVGKGRNRRRLTQEEADAYSLETGKLYKQMILRYGNRALNMPLERAKDFISAKADDARDLALLRVTRR